MLNFNPFLIYSFISNILNDGTSRQICHLHLSPLHGNHIMLFRTTSHSHGGIKTFDSSRCLPVHFIPDMGIFRYHRIKCDFFSGNISNSFIKTIGNPIWLTEGSINFSWDPSPSLKIGGGGISPHPPLFS